jgi:hypothetical protein
MDMGWGFGEDHAAYWTSSEPFLVSGHNGSLAQVSDRYLMHQKLVLGLTVPKELRDHIDRNVPINFSSAVIDKGSAWPDAAINDQIDWGASTGWSLKKKKIPIFLMVCR